MNEIGSLAYRQEQARKQYEFEKILLFRISKFLSEHSGKNVNQIENWFIGDLCRRILKEAYQSKLEFDGNKTDTAGV